MELKIQEQRKQNFVKVENVVLKSISTPTMIQRVAQDKGINPQEVFVRATFEYGGKDVVVSNKLRYLTKAGYVELATAVANKTPVTLEVDTESGFFHVVKDIKVDDLFKDSVAKTDVSKFNLAVLLK